jgi:5-(carboxyamino)imidazole ribonucleotide mutase
LPQVTLIVGSKSDTGAAKGSVELLQRYGVDVAAHVCSAHRAPERLAKLVRQAEADGTRVFIAGAGLAAALPGAVAGLTRRPVVGLPLASGALNGVDSLLSISQMPPGVPVATVAINGAANAAWLALEILALTDPKLDEQLATYRTEQSERIDSFD